MRLWIIILFLIPTLTFAQSYKDGIVVIQYSADFVKANEIDISKLEGADLLRLAMTEHPKIFEKEQLKEELLKIAPKILQFSQPVWLKIDQFKKQKKKILKKILFQKILIKLFILKITEFQKNE